MNGGRSDGCDEKKGLMWTTTRQKKNNLHFYLVPNQTTHTHTHKYTRHFINQLEVDFLLHSLDFKHSSITLFVLRSATVC